MSKHVFSYVLIIKHSFSSKYCDLLDLTAKFLPPPPPIFSERKSRIRSNYFLNKHFEKCSNFTKI